MPILENITQKNQKPLIVLYGIPGVGKLTVAKELHKITNLPLFHNHLSKDLVDSVFSPNKPMGLINEIRFSFFKTACEQNLGLVFTFVYAKTVDDDFMNRITNIAESIQTPIYFIQLTCQESVLKTRIENESRTKHNKVRDFSLLQETMKKYDLLSPYSNDKNHLIIDTTNIEPAETANQILQLVKY